MDNSKKQILQRVIDFYIENANTDRKTIRTVACLMNDIEAINYTRCCEMLNKDIYEHVLIFEDGKLISDKFIKIE